MERSAKNAVLVLLLLLILSCLLVYPQSPPTPHSVFIFSSMPRSLRLGSQQQHPTALKLTSSQEMELEAGINLGKLVARMDFEVNDYPPPDHNHHHGPGH